MESKISKVLINAIIKKFEREVDNATTLERCNELEMQLLDFEGKVRDLYPEREISSELNRLFEINVENTNKINLYEEDINPVSFLF